MIKAIIVDDEKSARELLTDYLKSYCKNIEVVALADGVEKGIEIINTNNFDVLFLDVHMGDGTGFDLLNRLKNREFQVIFITAHDHYAIDAFKFSALDYLLKPINPEKLIISVKKLEEKAKQSEVEEKYLTLLSNKNSFEKIALPTLNGFQFVKVSEIIRCEADGGYTNFIVNNQNNILVTKTLKEFDLMLSGLNFVRCHQKHLININYISQYLKGDGGIVIMEDGSEIDVSRRKKDDLLKALIG